MNPTNNRPDLFHPSGRRRGYPAQVVNVKRQNLIDDQDNRQERNFELPGGNALRTSCVAAMCETSRGGKAPSYLAHPGGRGCWKTWTESGLVRTT